MSQDDLPREMTNLNRFCAGVVTYNPDIKRLELVLGSIVGQVESLIVADNGSENIDEIERVTQSFGNAILLKNNENKGIATALNQICRYAKQQFFSWVLTLDQDTICPSDIVEKLSKGTAIKKVGIVCPAVDYEGINLNTYNKQEEIEEDTACMTSASLTNILAWEEVDGFKDDYFIDFVDNEFCMKLRIYGYKILRVNSCAISHRLGNSVERQFLWKKIRGTSHRPWRIYYMVRNNLLFISEYKHNLNIVKEYVKVIYILLNEFYFSDKKKCVMQYAWKGLTDAIHHKTGKML